ncbi:MAG: hemerythrin domain-containing protein [Candidatus Limnocylindria bacterium]
MATVKSEQVDRFLGTIQYPADRERLISQARTRRAAQAFRQLLDQLPNRDFDSPANVRQALARIEPSLRSGPEPESGGTAPAQSGGQPNALVQPILEVADTARVQGGRIIHQAGETVATRAEEQKGTLSQALSGVVETIRETGRSAQERGQQPVAQAADFAAGQLESVSDYFEQTDVRQIARQAQDFARQQPWLVLGIGIGIGLVATRLVRSTQIQELTRSPAPRAGANGGNGRRVRSASVEAVSSTDAIALLESDHREIRKLLQRGESAAVNRRTQTLGQVKRMLQAHERMEEEVFYPALQDNPATRQLVLESFAEHEVVDEILGEIEKTDASDELWKPRFIAMKDNLEHHVEEEETRLLPLARKAFTRGELAELGRRMQEIKQVSTERQPA